MIAIDTDVVLAFLTESGPNPQHREARDLVISEARKSGVYIPYAVLFELAGILASIDRERIVHTFSAILQTSGLIVENGPALADALETFRSSDASLTACMKLSSATAAGVTHFYTNSEDLHASDETVSSP